MTIICVYNNIEGSSDTKLIRGPGLSFWIQKDDCAFIFDFGADGTAIVENIRRLGLDTSILEGIIISHNHWDHLYGIIGILGERNYSLPVYVTPDTGEVIRSQIPSVKSYIISEAEQLSSWLSSTGPIPCNYKGISFSEQSLMVHGNQKDVLLTGCAHPGLEQCVEQGTSILKNRRIDLLAGGFHLKGKTENELNQLSRYLKDSGVDRIAPSHCTGEKQIQFFEKNWGENYVSLKLGNSCIIP